MGNKFAIAGLGLMVLWASPSWAGATGNGWAQPAAATVPPAAVQESQQRAQPEQTWVLHGKKVSCSTKHGWRHSEYVSHCGQT